MIRFKNLLEWSCFICAACALIVWPLPHTIALRNIVLGFGALSALIWMFSFWTERSKGNIFSLLIMLAVPLWLLLHYLSFSVNKDLAWYDLSGTWLRVTLSVTMGFGLGLMYKYQPKWPTLLVGITALYPLAVFIEYPFLLSKGIGLLQQYQEYPSQFFKYKSAAAYFLGWSCLIAYAILDFQKTRSGRKLKNIATSVLAVLLAGICFVDFIAFRTLNGIMLAASFGFLLILKILVVNLKMLRSGWIIATLLSFVIALIASIFFYGQYDAGADGKLKNLVKDATISWDIDRSDAWQLTKDPNKLDLIADASGRIVNESTYMRISWFRYGLKLLIQNPLGVGYTHAAFDHYMQQRFPGSRAHKTHSGWLDYALGVGLPGLFFTWIAIFTVIVFSIQNLKYSPAALDYVAVWGLFGIWCLWWVSELSEREFIEHLFFMISFLTSSLCLPNHYASKQPSE
ncbi:hypothetical protein [Polynucleobacter sp. MWH-UH23A]|uniref:hypothetical protein n=1 Tax=Polynucleobacter sp. MWH-UH23A TaxID=1855613 RepID=UPI0033652939